MPLVILLCIEITDIGEPRFLIAIYLLPLVMHVEFLMQKDILPSPRSMFAIFSPTCPFYYLLSRILFHLRDTWFLCSVPPRVFLSPPPGGDRSHPQECL